MSKSSQAALAAHETGLAKYFQFAENKTNLRTEILAGITTFMTMAYIVVVNPSILASAFAKGSTSPVDDFRTAIMIATIVSAGLTTILMGLLARYPFALAPGMGLNAYFATIILAEGSKFDAATVLGAVFISGVVFLILTLIGARELIVSAIPDVIKQAIPVGIGLFIAFIGLREARLIKVTDGGVGLGDMVARIQLPWGTYSPVLTVIGLAIIGLLLVRRVKGAVFLGIILTTLIGAIPYFGVTQAPQGSWVSLPAFDKWSLVLGKLDPLAALNTGLLTVIFAFLFVDMFDTVGTLIGVADQGGFLKDGKLERVDKALLTDSIGTIAGSIFGTSTVTSYIESAAGVGAGGRTGMTAITTGLLFLLALFFGPVLGVIPGPATYPALIIVGVMMMSGVGRIRWNEYTEAIPAFLAIILMPLTGSIANGIAAAFVAYAFLMLVSGKGEKVHWLVYVLGVLFALRFAFLPAI